MYKIILSGKPVAKEGGQKHPLDPSPEINPAIVTYSHAVPSIFVQQ